MTAMGGPCHVTGVTMPHKHCSIDIVTADLTNRQRVVHIRLSVSSLGDWPCRRCKRLPGHDTSCLWPCLCVCPSAGGGVYLPVCHPASDAGRHCAGAELERPGRLSLPVSRGGHSAKDGSTVSATDGAEGSTVAGAGLCVIVCNGVLSAEHFLMRCP